MFQASAILPILPVNKLPKHGGGIGLMCAFPSDWLAIGAQQSMITTELEACLRLPYQASVPLAR